MKLTVITNKEGEIIGAMKGRVSEPDTSQKPSETAEWKAGLRAGPGQRLHEIDAPDDIDDEDPGELHKRLVEHVKQYPLK